MSMGSKRLAACVMALGVSACASHKNDADASIDASSFDAAPDGDAAGALDGDAASADAIDAGPPCVLGGTSADLPVTLGCDQAPPGRVVVAGDYVYWTVQGPGPIVLRAPLTGGSAEALVSDVAGAFGLLVDEHFIYYTQPLLARVMRLPLNGKGAPITLAGKVDQPWLLASDGASLYWTAGRGNGKVMKLAVSGELVTLIDGQSQPRAIAVRDGFVYWTDFTDGTLQRTADHLLGPADAGVRVSSRLASGLAAPTDLVLVGGFAYVPDRAGHIRRVSLEGGELETIADVDGLPYGLATDGVALYWSVLGEGGAIFTAPITGGPGAVFVEGQSDPHFLAISAENVYWATWGARPAIHRLPR